MTLKYEHKTLKFKDGSIAKYRPIHEKLITRNWFTRKATYQIEPAFVAVTYPNKAFCDSHAFNLTGHEAVAFMKWAEGVVLATQESEGK